MEHLRLLVAGVGIVSLTALLAAHVHSTFDTTPVAVTTLSLSYSVSNLVADDKVTFSAHAGKVVESRAALDSLVKVDAPKQEIFKGQKPHE